MVGAIIAAIGLAISIGTTIYTEAQKKKEKNENANAAYNAARVAKKALSLRQMQEQQAAGATLLQMDKAARRAEADTRLAAGEAGVAGTSVDLLIADIERQRTDAERVTLANLVATEEQLSMEKLGADATAASRANAVPGANWGVAGLKIAGSALDAAGQVIDYRTRERRLEIAGGNLNEKGA